MNETTNETQQEMPRYKCHKEVHALKIESIALDSEIAKEAGRETDGSAVIYPADEGYGPFRVDGAYLRKHDPQVGGYYVVYPFDGYKSYSPAEVFEDGYTRNESGDEMTSEEDGDSTLLGFLAVSVTVAKRMATFPTAPGFDEKEPAADLQAQLAQDDSWAGYSVSIDGNGKLRLGDVRHAKGAAKA